MKISKSKIRKLIKESLENISERISNDNINFDDIFRNSGNIPPIEPPEDEGGGGGGGGDFIYLITLCKKMLKMGYNTNMLMPSINSVDEILKFDKSGLPESIMLEKDIVTQDGEEVSFSFHAEFDSLQGVIYASCFDPDEGFTDIIDGFSYQITDNFGYINFMHLTKAAEKMVMGKTSSEIISLGNKLFSSFRQ